MSQTDWVVDGEKKTEVSIEGAMTSAVMSTFRADKTTFMSSGREDVDVKMLGRGRPFVLEISNPRKSKHTTQDMTDLQKVRLLVARRLKCIIFALNNVIIA